MSDRTYRGFDCRQNYSYARGSWGRWTIERNGRIVEECQSYAECVYRIDQRARHDATIPPAPVKRVRKVQRIRTPRIVSDGGLRAATGFSGVESGKTDCVVRATAHTRCITYADAHRLANRLLMRENDKGVNTAEMLNELRRAQWCREVRLLKYWTKSGRQVTGMTLDAFAAAHPKGHYFVGVSRHAVAVCDGVIYDAWRISGLKRVRYAFEVTA